MAILQQLLRKKLSVSVLTKSLIEKDRIAPHTVSARYPDTREGPLLRFLFAAVASLVMVGGAIAADLPRKEPPPPPPAVGKAPIGKLPFGKGPVVARY